MIILKKTKWVLFHPMNISNEFIFLNIPKTILK